MIVVRVVLSCWPFTITLIFRLFIERYKSTIDIAIFVQEYQRNRDIVLAETRMIYKISPNISEITLHAIIRMIYRSYRDLFVARDSSDSIYRHARSTRKKREKEKMKKIKKIKEKPRKVRDKCAMNDNTVLFSSLLLDACIVPVSVPVCHLDSRQLQQPPPSLMNNQQHQLQHQNNPPHLAYQQANHHSYTTVTTSNQHGPSHLPPGGGVMGAHQQGPVLPHLQQQVSPLLFREFLCALSPFFFSLSLSLSPVCFLSNVCAFYPYFLCACSSGTSELPQSTTIEQ